jgi:hypothetical protein
MPRDGSIEAAREHGCRPSRRTAAGLQDVVSECSSQSSPPGTYYVRVRAANVSGSSAPSDENVVIVPY